MTPRAPLLVFYQEPEGDRWVPFDRHPRRFIRRLLRRERPSGHKKVFANLVAGLRRAGIPFAANDFRAAARDPKRVACIVGKPHLLDERPWKNPVLFGAATFSHPTDDPSLFDRTTVQRILVPGEWARAMWAQHWGDRIESWPVGIDTHAWTPGDASRKDIDVLLYNKIRWNHARMDADLVEPIRAELRRRGHSFAEVKYGAYREQDFRELTLRCRAMVFVCEHETQGIAYQEALAAGVPILAWERGGFWQDPNYFPERVKFAPVSAVPYFDGRCGMKFESAADFPPRLAEFMDAVGAGGFDPRTFIMENLTLEECARRYAAIHDRVAQTG